MEDTLRFAVLSHAMDVRIYGPLLVLLTLSTLPKLPTVCAIVLARLNDILSWLLNVVLCRLYPIKTDNNRHNMPTCPYRWPNGQGDVGKFLQGMENSELWKHKFGDVYRIWSGTSSEVVLTRPEDIRSVFKDSDTHRKAADNNAGWLMGEILGKCLGLISGPDWRTLHAVVGTPFLRKNSVEYIPRIEQQTKRYFNDLYVHGRLDQGLLNPIDDLKLLPFWITAEIIYGELPPEAEQKLQNLIPIRESLFRLMITGKLTRFKLYKCRSKVFGSLQITLGVAKSLILLVLAIAYYVLQRYTTKHQDWESEEREQLIPNGQPPSTEYGSLKPSQQVNVQPRVEDAQSLGWMDYFIGFRVLLPYLWPSNSWKEQLIIVLCAILSASQRLVNILVPYQLGVLVDSLKEGKLPYKEISIYVLLQGLQGQQGILGSVRALIWIRISQSLYQRLTVAAFEHVLSLSLDFHLSKRIGEVISALNRGSALNTFFDGFAFQLFPMVFDLGVAAVYLFIRFDAFYSLVVIGVMWSYIYMTIYMAKYRGRARREMAKRDREMDAKKTDAIMSYETVSYNAAQAMEISGFKRTVTSFQEAENSVLCSLNLLNVTQNLIFTLGIALIIGLSGYQIFLGKHSIATFVSLLAYFSQLHAPLAFFGSFYNQVQNNLVDAERMLALFQHRPETTDHPDAIVLPQRSGEIRFTNVNFSYNPRKPALENISFTVSPGTTTALVGESGSGKSTCLKLLFRFYDAKSGAITIDGNDIRNVTLKSLRDQISVVPQDTILFNESLLYNLLYAKPDATLSEVFEACKAASIHQKILGFPNGYDTAVGERGLRLSGGEKQRIAIARALLRNPKIMLLDEATASLDTHTEKEIQSALARITHHRTTITIAHRLSTVTKADQILVLHEGKIVECGRHVELLRSGTMYKSLWDRQTEAEKGEQTD